MSETPPDRLARARAFWGGLGCRLVELDPEAHDAALALTSHLPHAVAAALAAAVPENLLPLTAGAYRDGTRVAGSDAALWAGIFVANRVPVLDAIGAFQDELSRLKMALMEGDDEAIRVDLGRVRPQRVVTYREVLPALDPRGDLVAAVVAVGLVSVVLAVAAAALAARGSSPLGRLLPRRLAVHLRGARGGSGRRAPSGGVGRRRARSRSARRR